MKKHPITSGEASHDSGAYSPALKFGNLVFVSGQGPLHPVTGELQGATIREQTRHTLENIQGILNDAGATLDTVLKVNAYLADIKDFGSFNATYAEYFTQPQPARTTVACSLFQGLIEIDCIAYVPDGRSDPLDHPSRE